MVQNGARKGDGGVKWGKEGWKQCKVVQGGVVMVQNGARRGQRWCKMVRGGAAVVQNGAWRGCDGGKCFTEG